jgi:hypothetical protein
MTQKSPQLSRCTQIGSFALSVQIKSESLLLSIIFDDLGRQQTINLWVFANGLPSC